MAIEWPSTINASPGCIKAKNWRLGRDVASSLNVASFTVSPFVSFCQRRLRAVLASVIVCCSRASADAIPDHSLGGVALVPPIGGAFVMPACPPSWFPAAPWCAGGPCGTAPALLVPAGAPRFSGTSWLRCLGGPWPCPIPSPHGCPCLAGWATRRVSWLDGCPYYQVGDCLPVGTLPACVTHNPRSHLRRRNYYYLLWYVERTLPFGIPYPRSYYQLGYVDRGPVGPPRPRSRILAHRLRPGRTANGFRLGWSSPFRLDPDARCFQPVPRRD